MPYHVQDFVTVGTLLNTVSRPRSLVGSPSQLGYSAYTLHLKLLKTNAFLPHALAVLFSSYACTSFVEMHFVHVEFDENSIYTFAPSRGRHVIPWSDVVGYHYSAVNRWHILKTHGHGSIRLSELLSGLGTMREKWENVLHHETSNQSLEPTAGRSDDHI